MKRRITLIPKNQSDNNSDIVLEMTPDAIFCIKKLQKKGGLKALRLIQDLIISEKYATKMLSRVIHREGSVSNIKKSVCSTTEVLRILYKIIE